MIASFLLFSLAYHSRADFSSCGALLARRRPSEPVEYQTAGRRSPSMRAMRDSSTLAWVSSAMASQALVVSWCG